MKKIAICSLLWIAFAASASGVESTCQGNIETYDKKIIKAGVSYLLWYEVAGTKAKIRFAGREFESEVATSIGGTAWKGRWFRKISDATYFSFLPEEGGTIKFEFESDRWFSGNCSKS